MNVFFNIEKLDKLLSDFHAITGLTISVWDESLRQITHQPKDHAAYCSLIRSSTEGEAACLACDRTLLARCREEGHAVSHRCHAGLVDTAFPIRFENEVLGYMMFGQIKSEDSSVGANEFRAIAARLSLPEKELRKAFSEIHPFPTDTIDSAANILKAATRYIWLSDLIRINYNTLSTQMDAYISQNLTSDLSVNAICRQFHISKTSLYALVKKNFNSTVSAYITSKRIAAARQMLLTTDDPIYTISAQVGIPDYNYFSKVFRKLVGVTPREFRQQHEEERT